MHSSKILSYGGLIFMFPEMDFSGMMDPSAFLGPLFGLIGQVEYYAVVGIVFILFMFLLRWALYFTFVSMRVPMAGLLSTLSTWIVGLFLFSTAQSDPAILNVAYRIGSGLVSGTGVGSMFNGAANQTAGQAAGLVSNLLNYVTSYFRF